MLESNNIRESRKALEALDKPWLTENESNLYNLKHASIERSTTRLKELSDEKRIIGYERNNQTEEIKVLKQTKANLETKLK